MSKFPHLPLFTDAFIADTMHLSAAETGAYLMLLMVAWRSPECRLPDDDQKLARWARVEARHWPKVKQNVMTFWTLSEGYWTQARLLKEHAYCSKSAAVARANGKLGGRPKSLETLNPDNPAGSSRVPQQKAPIPIPIQEGSTEPSLIEDSKLSSHPKPSVWGSFDEFWAAYPAKVGKEAARRKFERIRRGGKVAFPDLMAGLQRYKASKPPDRDWCHPTTWLNQGRWEDEASKPNGAGHASKFRFAV